MDASMLRRSLWVSSLITLVALGIFVGASAVIPRPQSPALVAAIGILIAVIPGLIWMGFFYQQDRIEPEPKRLVARVFVFGALAAGLTPAIDALTHPTLTQASGIVVRLLLTILTVSLIQETLKLAMVRYVVLGTNAFDAHPDGIVYGLAAGFGFGTVLTLTSFLASDGVIPLQGAIMAVDNALVHGALGAITGYYIGRVKLDGKKLPWMLAGLAIATVLNGLYAILRDELNGRLTFNPWYALGIAIVLAVGVGAVLFAIFRRAMLRATGELQTVSVQAHARSKEMPWDIHVRYDYLIIGGLCLALVVNWLGALIVTSRTVAYSGEGLPLTFSYPAGWAVQADETTELLIRDLTGEGIFRPEISASGNKVGTSASLDFVVAQSLAAYGASRTLYQETEREEDVTVDDVPAARISYQYAEQSASGPVVVRGVVTYVLVGEWLCAFRYEAESDVFADSLSQYEQLLRSIQFDSAE